MAEVLHLLAAGSLAKALANPEPVAGRLVITRFGASGLLREAIEMGAPWDIFVSANTDHPARLHRAGLGTPPRAFCRNRLCLILRPEVAGHDAAALLGRHDLRIGISTPGNDPSGDYAIEVLRRLDRIAPGANAVERARPLTGAPDLPVVPEGRNTYAWHLVEGAADLFLTYRSNGIAARTDTPELRVLDLPEPLAVQASYALITRKGAPPEVEALADRLLAMPLQGRLRVLGFDPVPQLHRSPA